MLFFIFFLIYCTVLEHLVIYGIKVVRVDTFALFLIDPYFYVLACFLDVVPMSA